MDSPGIYPLKFEKCYVTTSQLKAANKESIRLGFSRNLELPDDIAELNFPIERAWRHVSLDNLVNIRLMILFAPDLSRATELRPLTLDVTHDRWEEIKRNKISDLLEGSHE